MSPAEKLIARMKAALATYDASLAMLDESEKHPAPCECKGCLYVEDTRKLVRDWEARHGIAGGLDAARGELLRVLDARKRQLPWWDAVDWGVV